MIVNKDAQKIIDESPNRQKLELIIKETSRLMASNEIQGTELQWTILINHLNEMIKREQTGEKIIEVDPVMFDEVSEEALMISKRVTDLVGVLPIDEMYVLSIHFESAKQNEDLK